MVRRWVRFERLWVTSGERCCAVAVRVTCPGTACSILLRGGSHRLMSVILILLCVSASLPKVGAGCGNAARPDLSGGRSETSVPTGTLDGGLLQGRSENDVGS